MMNVNNFDPDKLIETYHKNLPYFLLQELESGVPLNIIDEKGRYLFIYNDGTVLPASLDISFEENWENHKKIMAEKWGNI